MGMIVMVVVVVVVVTAVVGCWWWRWWRNGAGKYACLRIVLKEPLRQWLNER